MSCLDRLCSAWTAIRSSSTLRLRLSAMAACSAALLPYAWSTRMPLTYCWAIVDPPWTGWWRRSFISARRVPLTSSAPCVQYLSSSIAVIAWIMYGEIWL